MYWRINGGMISLSMKSLLSPLNPLSGLLLSTQDPFNTVYNVFLCFQVLGAFFPLNSSANGFQHWPAEIVSSLSTHSNTASGPFLMSNNGLVII